MGRRRLSAGERRQLDEAGHVLLTGLLDPAQIQRLRAAVEVLWQSEGEQAGRENYVEEGARRLANLANKGSRFREAYRHPLVLAAARHVLGHHVRVSMLNARDALPGGDRRQPLHCDTDRGATPDERGYLACTAVWMLDDFTRESGATRLVPGSHTWGQVPKQVLSTLTEAHADEVVVVGRAGDVSVFNGHCWHAGAPNQTTRPRRSVLVHYLRAGVPRRDDRRQHISPDVLPTLDARDRELLGLDDPAHEQGNDLPRCSP